jgi:hypothetical protein
MLSSNISQFASSIPAGYMDDDEEEDEVTEHVEQPSFPNTPEPFYPNPNANVKPKKNGSDRVPLYEQSNRNKKVKVSIRTCIYVTVGSN